MELVNLPFKICKRVPINMFIGFMDGTIVVFLTSFHRKFVWLQSAFQVTNCYENSLIK